MQLLNQLKIQPKYARYSRCTFLSCSLQTFSDKIFGVLKVLNKTFALHQPIYLDLICSAAESLSKQGKLELANRGTRPRSAVSISWIILRENRLFRFPAKRVGFTSESHGLQVITGTKSTEWLCLAVWQLVVILYELVCIMSRGARYLGSNQELDVFRSRLSSMAFFFMNVEHKKI